LSTSSDAPALSGVYKLVEIGERGNTRSVMKRSTDKATRPGTKQVWRTTRSGHAVEDVVTLSNEAGPQDGVPLLEPVMARGRRLNQAPTLAALQRRARMLIAQLPDTLRRLDAADIYSVTQSAGLRELGAQIELEWESSR